MHCPPLDISQSASFVTIVIEHFRILVMAHNLPAGTQHSIVKRCAVTIPFSHSHLEGSSTSVGRPGNCQYPVLSIENADVRQPIVFDVSPDGVHVS